MPIYFLQDAGRGWVKVGTSSDPGYRTAYLQTVIPSPLRLLGTIPGGRSKEMHYHAYLRGLQVPKHELKAAGYPESAGLTEWFYEDACLWLRWAMDMAKGAVKHDPPKRATTISQEKRKRERKAAAQDKRRGVRPKKKPSFGPGSGKRR